MKLSSPQFSDNQEIPKIYSAYGDNINPPLIIEDVPDKTKSLALIIEDPDAASEKPWQHWLLWNIPPDTKVIEEGTLPSGSTQGANSSNVAAYFGPKPPSGLHHYYFKLYALDTMLDLASRSSREELDTALEGHIIDESLLVGLYMAPV